MKMSKRNIEIRVCLNRKEAEALNKRVKKCGLSREGYLRHLITGVVPRETPPADYYEQFGELKYKYRNREFLCRGYYVDTVGKNETRIAEYIKNLILSSTTKTD